MKRLAIACPNRDDFKGETVVTLIGLATQCIQATGEVPVLLFPQTVYIDNGRNIAVDMAMGLNVDYVLFVDTDMSLNPAMTGNIIEKMLNMDKDVLCGLYVDRGYPHRAHVYKFSPYGIQSIPDVPKECFEVEATGCGFMLIARRVLEALKQPEFEKEYGKPFHFLNYNMENELREDVAFCWRARKAGFSVWIDPAISLSHWGKTAYTIEHWEYIKTTLKAQMSERLEKTEMPGDAENPISGWMRPEECAFLRGVAKEMTGGIIEIGCYKGRSTKELLDSGNPVIAIDSWEGSPDKVDETYGMDGDAVYAEFLENVSGYENLLVCRDTSLNQAKMIYDKSVDMVFIDAAHDYMSVKADIAAWLPKARKLICGHDYDQGWPGVVQAVNEAFPDGKIKRIGSIWIREIE